MELELEMICDKRKLKWILRNGNEWQIENKKIN